MIRSLRINNFKSLMDFALPGEQSVPDGLAYLPKFVCLVGLNGSGKSTLLQAFDFLRATMAGEIRAWLTRRDWKSKDIKFKDSFWAAKVVDFTITIEIEGREISWWSYFSSNMLRCTYEKVVCDGVVLFEVKKGELKLHFDPDGKFEPILFAYEGSILSQLKDVMFSDAPMVLQLKNAILGIKSLDLLSPHLIRGAARDGELGLGGERLSPSLYRMSKDQESTLQELVKRFYPSLNRYMVKAQKYGWKKLYASESRGFGQQNIEVDARHINDGMLRILAILTLTLSDASVLLLDEIENGINPELVGQLMSYLRTETDKQIIVTTHSPLILNYLPDSDARDGVFLLYKANGKTKAVKFFSLPETTEKLGFLGPGEVYVDTPLVELVNRLASEDISR